MRTLLLVAVAVLAVCGVALAVPNYEPGPSRLPDPRPHHPGAHNPAPRPSPYYYPPRYPVHPYYVVVNGKWVLVYPSPYVRPYYPAYPPHYQPRPYYYPPHPYAPYPRPYGPSKYPRL